MKRLTLQALDRAINILQNIIDKLVGDNTNLQNAVDELKQIRQDMQKAGVK